MFRPFLVTVIFDILRAAKVWNKIDISIIIFLMKKPLHIYSDLICDTLYATLLVFSVSNLFSVTSLTFF